MPKLHLFDLLYNKFYNKSTTNPQQIEMLYNKSESTTNPQQIEAMEFGFDLLWTCSVAANQRADVDDVLVTKTAY